jgi:hypothetical protein
MATDSSTGTFRPRGNNAVIAALWVIAVVAVIEVILAAVALAPRVASGMRAGISTQSPANGASAFPGSTASSMLPPQPAGLPQPQIPLPPSSVATQNDQPAGIPSNNSLAETAVTGAPTLQIVNAKLLSGDDGSKKLQISIKANSHDPIDVPQVRVQVYFYDQDSGEIVPSKAQVTSNWLSTPIDWRKGEPELLEVQYLPDTSSTDVTFAGYLVAIYYKGDLQDCRANPARLKKLFEPKYYIGSDE